MAFKNMTVDEITIRVNVERDKEVQVGVLGYNIFYSTENRR